MKSPRRYPKPKERYEQYRLNPWSPLYGSVVFLFLSNPRRITGSKVYEDGHSRLAATPTEFVPEVSWQDEIGRYATYFPGYDLQKLLFYPDTRIQSYNVPISMYAMWKFDGSAQDDYVHIGGNWNNIYFGGRNISYSSWGIVCFRHDSAKRYLKYASHSDFAQVAGWNVFCTASPPATYPKFYFNSIECTGQNINILTKTPSAAISLGANQGTPGDFELKGWIADFAIFDELLPDSYLLELSDRSNVDLRVGGVPLLLPPKRIWWPSTASLVSPKKTPWHLMTQGAI